MKALLLVGALLATAALTGCSVNVPAASPGDLGPQRRIMTLGAGDALGREVYVNDLIIAAAAAGHPITYTDAQTADAPLAWE